eukprot:gnl/MRDRNA2_/MRDRNA2_110265_c0_seq1.p1 gnl/MRDRNA2_/MRDRNA2_110265_c0~~gnl/MRDRNA2_/MRDRNA2_110265_c0_seq1.p1  ORF type:complete len:520 (+),score=143.75 gnl/MRDRNA2_/MRDRNA2_110265_c0_seq1:80-1639(+)
MSQPTRSKRPRSSRQAADPDDTAGGESRKSEKPTVSTAKPTSVAVPRSKAKVGPSTAKPTKQPAPSANKENVAEDGPEDQQKIQIVNTFCPAADRQELVDIWRKVGGQDIDIEELVAAQDDKLDADRKKLSKEREKFTKELLSKFRQNADRECSVVEERAADKADELRRAHAQAENEDKQVAEQEVEKHRATQGKLRLKAAQDVMNAELGITQSFEDFFNAANGSMEIPVNQATVKLQEAIQGGLDRLKTLKEATEAAQEEFEDQQIELAEVGRERKEQLETALEQVDRQRRTDLDALEAMHNESVEKDEELVSLNTEYALKEASLTAEVEQKKKELKAFADEKYKVKVLEDVEKRFDLERITRSLEIIQDPPPSLIDFQAALRGLCEAVRTKGRSMARRAERSAEHGAERGADRDAAPSLSVFFRGADRGSERGAERGAEEDQRPRRKKKRRVAEKVESSASASPPKKPQPTGRGAGGGSVTLRPRSDHVEAISESRSSSPAPVELRQPRRRRVMQRQ